MDFAVVSTAQRDGELITYLASKCSALCKSEVVRIGRLPTRKSNKDVLRQISDALDRELVATQNGRDRLFRFFR
jgi:hypothetical protein